MNSRNNIKRRKRKNKEVPEELTMTCTELLVHAGLIILAVVIVPYAMYFFDSKAAWFVLIVFALNTIFVYKNLWNSEEDRESSFLLTFAEILEQYFPMGLLIALTTIVDGVISHKLLLATLICIPGSAIVTTGLVVPSAQ